jgi:hypothetical protein
MPTTDPAPTVRQTVTSSDPLFDAASSTAIATNRDRQAIVAVPEASLMLGTPGKMHRCQQAANYLFLAQIYLLESLRSRQRVKAHNDTWQYAERREKLAAVCIQARDPDETKCVIKAITACSSAA